MLSKAQIKSRPTVLWCYKHKLELSSHVRKRQKQIKKMRHQGLWDPEKADAFSLFVESGNITYCLYKDSEKVLNNTFGMCILQVSYTSTNSISCPFEDVFSPQHKLIDFAIILLLGF
ncbi:unnamed protein product [Lathyrus sativus]|nr:unnamed protein product [Lathyrus sativus]